MTTYGYARVSTDKQDAAYQIDLLLKAGVPRANIFTDVMSGKLYDRPGYVKLNLLLHRGDKVHFTQLSRIGRKQRETIDWLVGEQDPPGLEKRGIKFFIANCPFLNTSEGAMIPGIRRVVMELLGYLAEEELAQKSYATKAGNNYKRGFGMKPGAPPISEYKRNAIRTMAAAGVTIATIVKDLGVSKDTVRRYVRDPDYNPTPPITFAKAQAIRTAEQGSVVGKVRTEAQREASRRNGKIGNPYRGKAKQMPSEPIVEPEYAF